MDTTVIKALKLLEVLSASESARGVTDLAEEMNLTKANVHRLLRTLLTQGYVVQREGQSKYMLSMKLWELGSRALSRLDLTEVARPIVRELCLLANESVQLAIPEGTMAVYVDKADSTHPLRATTQIGSRVPMHCVSCGKAMLAFSESLVARLEYPLSRHTPHTVVQKRALEKELAQIREDGVAVNQGEWREGIWGIAAPIHDATGQVVASIDVWGAETRFQGANKERLGKAVISAASQISQGLGYTGAAANNFQE